MRHFAFENFQTVRRLVFQKPGIRRFEISQGLHMAPASVSKYVDLLIKKEIVLETDTDRSRNVSLAMNPAWKTCLGVDVGAWKTRILRMDARGAFSLLEEIPTPEDPLLLAPALKRHERGVDGVGLAITAVIDPQKLRVELFANNRGWDGFALSALGLRSRLSLLSSGHAAATAEKSFGSLRDDRDAIHVNAGNGIQACVFIDGKAVAGANHAAGELGHVFASLEAGACSCGNVGCLENLATVPMLLGRLKKRMQAGELRGTLARLCENDAAKIDPARVNEAWEAGDPQVHAEILRTADAIASALSGLVNVLNPQAISLGGNLFAYFPRLTEAVRDSLLGKVLEPNARKLAIRLAAYPELGAAFGAALHAFERFLRDEPGGEDPPRRPAKNRSKGGSPS
ncbi:MAG: ROK family protein [Spirochaetes bacterium]|nr:ROK family protein [Spirochaetota bacterium]